MSHYIQGRFNAKARQDEFIKEVAIGSQGEYSPWEWTYDESEAFVFAEPPIKPLRGLFTRVTDRQTNIPFLGDDAPWESPCGNK